MQHFVKFIRSASLSAWFVSQCTLSFSLSSGLMPFGLLVPGWEGQLPLQTRLGFGNGLKIQSHRTVALGNRGSYLQCESCRKYKREMERVPFCVQGTTVRHAVSWS